MIASSIMDVYVGLFQWNMYEVLIDVLNGTGLTYLPFIMAIFATVAQSYGWEARETVSRLEVKLIAMVLTMILCFMPYKGLSTSLGAVQYNIGLTDCNPPSNISGSGTNTNSGYDDVMGDFRTGGFSAPAGSGLSVSQPIMWALVEYVSTAITYSSIKAAGCSNNYEFLLTRLASSRITDEALKGRVQDFHANCYKPAILRFNENPPAGVDRGSMLPWQDVDWIGSWELLLYGGLGTGEYYNHADVYLRDQGQYGFTPNPGLRQSDLENAGTANPYCSEVWQGSQGVEGIRGLLLTHFSSQIDAEGDSPYNDFMDFGWKTFTNATSLSVPAKEDMFLKLVLQADAANLSAINNVSLTDNVAAEQENESWLGSAIDLIGGIFGAYGAAGEIAQGMLLKFAIKTAGPMLLAMIQMCIILASPFLMVLSGYSFKMFGQLAVSYFAVEFVNAIFAFGFFFDNRIMDIFFSSAEGWDAPLAGAVVMATSIGTIFLLPVVWMGLMSTAGIRMIGGIGQAVGLGAVSGMAARGGKGFTSMGGFAGGSRGAGGATRAARN